MNREIDRYGRREVLRAIGAACLLGGVARGDDPEKPLPEQIVDALNTVFGKHPGYRAAHAKGLVCEGEFTPAASAATLAKAPHLKGPAVKVSARFSDSTGLPDIPDGLAAAGPRGLAVRFHLTGGGSTDLVTNASNGFAVATGEEFLELLKALATIGKDAPRPTPLAKFLAAHPEAAKVMIAPKPVPVSFATEPYFGVHAFEFTNAAGNSRFGRYQIRPEGGAQFLDAEEAAKKPPNFLIDELGERLARGPARFRIVVQLAGEGDPVDNATAVWPDDRPTVELGILSLTRLAADNDAAQRALAFDPLNLVDGIEPSDDPLLQIRSATYAVSRRRRKQTN
jgi:catalase